MCLVMRGKQKAVKVQAVQQVVVKSKMEEEVLDHLVDSTVWKVPLSTDFCVKSMTDTIFLEEVTALIVTLSLSTRALQTPSLDAAGSTLNNSHKDLVKSFSKEKVYRSNTNLSCSSAKQFYY